MLIQLVSKGIVVFTFLFLMMPSFAGTHLSPIGDGTNVEVDYGTVVQVTSPDDQMIILEHIWPLERNDPQRTGRAGYDTSTNKGGERWRYYYDSHSNSAPVIDKDGILYFGTGLDGFHAVYPNGTRKWHIPASNISGMMFNSPALAADGTIYIGTTQRLYAIHANGSFRWVFSRDARFVCPPTVDANGTVYTAILGTVFAIHPNGTVKWEFPVQKEVGAIALDCNGNVYFVNNYDTKLYCLTAEGELKWVYDRVNMNTKIAITDDGVVIVFSPFRLTAVNPDGSEKWTVELFMNIGFPSIAPDGTIILSGSGPYIGALNPDDGSIKWIYEIGRFGFIRPVSLAAIGADGTIFVAYTAYSDSLSFMLALTPAGDLKWETHLTTDHTPIACVNVLASPAIGSDGTVYIISMFIASEGAMSHGYLHAIGMDNPRVPEPPTLTGKPTTRLYKEYDLTICSDLDGGGDVYYLIDWNDDPGYIYQLSWEGPFKSGEAVTVSHTFKKLGPHTITVRAKGNDSLCSTWSTHEVQVSFAFDQLVSPFFEWLLERFPHAFPLLRHLLEY